MHCWPTVLLCFAQNHFRGCHWTNLMMFLGIWMTVIGWLFLAGNKPPIPFVLHWALHRLGVCIYSNYYLDFFLSFMSVWHPLSRKLRAVYMEPPHNNPVKYIRLRDSAWAKLAHRVSWLYEDSNPSHPDPINHSTLINQSIGENPISLGGTYFCVNMPKSGTTW